MIVLMTFAESPNSPEKSALARLLDIMARLRDPQTGCPWDAAQDFSSIAPYTIEEAYEVADAIEQSDFNNLKEELGDLLFQVIFHARMAEEANLFDFHAVADAIANKMIRRHPHVFGNDSLRDPDSQTRAWEAQKEQERRTKALDAGQALSVLDGIASNLPSITRALKLQKRAARIGFDWRTLDPVLTKIDEELDEVRIEIQGGGKTEALEGEVGDLLFSVVNLARHLGLDPDKALRRTNGKFERRFRALESSLARKGRNPKLASLEELEAHWQDAKKLE